MNHRRKRKKKSGFRIAVTVVLLLILATVILVSTGVISELKKNIDRKFYPLEHREAILKASEDYDMDPAFICAVIFTESKFREDVTSSAGAKGLMQLMPETFEYLAEKRGEEVPEDITDPEVNIDYGVYYLRYMTDTYGFKDLYTACAAYNAGPGAVTSWLKNKEYSKDGETLTLIPFEETENYIEKIKNAQEMYQSLYFDQ